MILDNTMLNKSSTDDEVDMFCDTHTHLAKYSNDAILSLDELLDEAGRKGLAAICTTDHYEKDVYYQAGREDIFDIQAYFNELQPIADQTALSSPRLLLGIEFGWLEHLDSHLTEIAEQWPFDQIILSLHILDGEDPYINPDTYVSGKSALYSRYIDKLREMIRRTPNFDIVGHFDYISRYAPFEDIKMRWIDAPDAFDNLFRTMIDMGKALEINTRSIVKLQTAGYLETDAFPDPVIIKRYLELGGRLISLGSDAHKPGEAGRLFEQTAIWLKRLGVKEVVHYEKRQPVFTQLAQIQ